MSRLLIHLALCLSAAFVPLVPFRRTVLLQKDFPGWPAHFDHRPLKPLPLSERERGFASGFPGRMAKFSDGRHELIIRWVTEPTRRLHPSADCFRASGYQVRALEPATRADGERWASFEASGKGQKLFVHERIFDASGKSWIDVSEWYWAALIRKTSGPWWSVVVVTRAGDWTGGVGERESGRAGEWESGRVDATARW